MAVGKAEIDLNVNSINLTIGTHKVLEKGQISKNY